MRYSRCEVVGTWGRSVCARLETVEQLWGFGTWPGEESRYFGNLMSCSRNGDPASWGGSERVVPEAAPNWRRMADMKVHRWGCAGHKGGVLFQLDLRYESIACRSARVHNFDIKCAVRDLLNPGVIEKACGGVLDPRGDPSLIHARELVRV